MLAGAPSHGERVIDPAAPTDNSAPGLPAKRRLPTSGWARAGQPLTESGEASSLLGRRWRSKAGGSKRRNGLWWQKDRPTWRPRHSGPVC